MHPVHSKGQSTSKRPLAGRLSDMSIRTKSVGSPFEPTSRACHRRCLHHVSILLCRNGRVVESRLHFSSAAAPFTAEQLSASRPQPRRVEYETNAQTMVG